MTLALTRRAALAVSSAAIVAPRRARAAERQTIRIGVLTDLNGPNAAANGPGSVVGAQLAAERSEEHTSELQSPTTISYAVFCL